MNSKKPCLRTGIDIVCISRIKDINENFKKKVFHSSERGNGTDQHLAGIFAAKEAFFKCIGIAPKWLNIEIKHEKSGRPYIKISKELVKKYKIKSTDLSISHEKEYAIALAVVVFDSYFTKFSCQKHKEFG